jgi:hypothetical protein
MTPKRNIEAVQRWFIDMTPTGLDQAEEALSQLRIQVASVSPADARDLLTEALRAALLARSACSLWSQVIDEGDGPAYSSAGVHPLYSSSHFGD